MALFKKDVFGNSLFLKKSLIRVMGLFSHRRYRGFNELHIEGSEIIRDLPDNNVLFVANHQTYFADVAAMLHVFNAALSGRVDNIKDVGYLWQPKLNIYFVAAKETMRSGILPKIMAYGGSISIERTWREKGKDVNKKVKLSDVSNITTEDRTEFCEFVNYTFLFIILNSIQKILHSLKSRVHFLRYVKVALVYFHSFPFLYLSNQI